jgi:hypothetical protein
LTSVAFFTEKNGDRKKRVRSGSLCPKAKGAEWREYKGGLGQFIAAPEVG